MPPATRSEPSRDGSGVKKSSRNKGSDFVEFVSRRKSQGPEGLTAVGSRHPQTSLHYPHLVYLGLLVVCINPSAKSTFETEKNQTAPVVLRSLHLVHFLSCYKTSPSRRVRKVTTCCNVAGDREIGNSLPNNQRQRRTYVPHCTTYCTPCRPLLQVFFGWILLR